MLQKPWFSSFCSGVSPCLSAKRIFLFVLSETPPFLCAFTDADSATWSWSMSQRASTTSSPPPSCPNRKDPSSWTLAALHPLKFPSFSEDGARYKIPNREEEEGMMGFSLDYGLSRNERMRAPWSSRSPESCSSFPLPVFTPNFNRQTVDMKVSLKNNVDWTISFIINNNLAKGLKSLAWKHIKTRSW